jgi:hypothetical protein
MTTPLRRIDMDAARAKMAAFDTKCQELRHTGQRMLARIRSTSKYFGQGKEGELFPVVVAAKGNYGVIGGPGGQYRLGDVDLFVLFDEDEEPIQITSAK